MKKTDVQSSQVVDVIQRLASFWKVDKLKKEILMVMINFLYKDTQNLKKINDAFNTLDTDHSGYIEIEKL